MNDNIIIKKFNSPVEFLEWATNAPCLWKGELVSRAIDRPAWFGTQNYEEAYQLALYGWEEGRQKLTSKVRLAERIIPSLPIRRRRYAIAGHYPNPARAASGEISSMVDRGHDFKQKPVLRIRNNFVFSGATSTDKIMNWGAALCSYVNHLQLTGQSVQLDAFFETPHPLSGGPDVSFQFPLKKAGDHLSLASVVFWWTHPSAFRRIVFSAKERLNIEQWYSRCYGGPVEPPRHLSPIEPGVLTLSMADAGNRIEQNLEIIRTKHAKLIAAGSSPAGSGGRDGFAP